jgi:hypothetical protein
MTLELGHILTIGAFVVAFIAWLVRLEGRVNSQKEQLVTLHADLAAANAKADAESMAHRETSNALIRVEEAVKHLTRLFEQHFTNTTRRRPPA